MNLFTKNMINCPKSCLQNCEYSEECLSKARGFRNSFIGLIFSKLGAIIGFGKTNLRRSFRKNEADEYQPTESYKLIHPVAKYKFSCTNNSSFALIQHIGKHLFEIQTINLELSPFPLKFSHILKDDMDGIITTLTFLPEMDRKACGTYNNHAILIELSEDCKEITMLLFEDMGIYQTELLQRWNVGKLVVEVEIKPLLVKKPCNLPQEKCIYTNVYIEALYNKFKKLFSFRKRGPGYHV
jgi:hypothetical protein